MKRLAHHLAKSLVLGYLGYFKCKFPSPISKDYESVVVEAENRHFRNMPRDSNTGGPRDRI